MNYSSWYMEKAIQSALKSDMRVRVGAVIVVSGSTWYPASNCKKTHPLLARYNYPPNSSTHAEMRVCMGLCTPAVRGSVIYVARILRNNTIAMAKPCTPCMHFMADIGIARVYYTNRDDGVSEINLCDWLSMEERGTGLGKLLLP